MEIRIGKSARTCGRCERDFAHDEQIHSLVRVAEEGFQREDFCGECWNEDAMAGAYCTWSPQYYDPAVAEAEPPEVFSPLRQLFYEAVEGESREELAKAYLAAQLLRRQKVFRLIKESDESEGDASLLLFADQIGDRLIEVRDPSLTHADLERGRQLLVERLAELEQPATAETANGDETDGARTEASSG